MKELTKEIEDKLIALEYSLKGVYKKKGFDIQVQIDRINEPKYDFLFRVLVQGVFGVSQYTIWKPASSHNYDTDWYWEG